MRAVRTATLFLYLVIVEFAAKVTSAAVYAAELPAARPCRGCRAFNAAAGAADAARH